MKNLQIGLFIIAGLLLSACSDEAPSSKAAATEVTAEKSSSTMKAAEMNKSDNLELIWEIQGLDNPESVVYDAASDSLYVSNVNGAPNEKDGNGYISKISPDGSMLRKHWVVGLNAPKGLAIYDNTLYVADFDTLVAIDIPSGTISNTYLVEDAQFFNDVAASADSKIFVSDMVLNRIHCLCDGEFSIWLESPELDNPNGLFIEGDNMILGSWGVMTDGFATAVPGHLKSISLQDKSVTNLGDTPIGNMDGVESDGHDGYFVTDWMVGKLYQINKAGEAKLLLELEQGMADLAVLADKKVILLPMMMNNKLLAYKIK